MKTVLCYGDSNTWGADAVTDGRHSRWVRWPGVLQKTLGDAYYVIEEGLNGRTTVWDDPIEGHKNGKTYLIPCLESHKPLDVVVLMLGSNDLKMRFSVSATDIANSARTLVDMIQRSRTGHDLGAPEVILICPPPIADLSAELAGMFEGAHAKAARLPQEFERVAQEMDCIYLNTHEFITPDPADGLHLTAEAHRKLGEAVSVLVAELVGV